MGNGDFKFDLNGGEKGASFQAGASGGMNVSGSVNNPLLESSMIAALGPQAGPAMLAALLQKSPRNGPGYSGSLADQLSGAGYSMMEALGMGPGGAGAGRSRPVQVNQSTGMARGANPFGANDNYIQQAIQRARAEKQYNLDYKNQLRDSRFSEEMDKEQLRKAQLENDNYSQNEYFDLLKSILNVSKTSMIPELRRLLRR